MAEEKKPGLVQQLRGSAVAKAIDKAIEKTDTFLGPSGKAWLANGLDELRQAVALGTEQVQAGNNPGLWGTITTGEATYERMAGAKDAAQTLEATGEVPGMQRAAAAGKMTMEQFYQHAAVKAQEAASRMDHQNDHQRERGGLEM
jgi:hypothetical protein